MNSHINAIGKVHTLDLHFQDIPRTIAAYLIPHARGAALVECGPGSTLVNLIEALKLYNLQPTDITDVLVTHIHLDHAGSAGWWARQGAHIHVHPVGAPHLEKPERLLQSAQRIYGNNMDALWGEFLPVPANKLVIHGDKENFEIEGLRFTSLDAPGHANHHLVYIFENICFSGDFGGVRISPISHFSLPMVPPEFFLELWRDSINKLEETLQSGGFTSIAPTHFGIFQDADWHLKAIRHLIDDAEEWIINEMSNNPSFEEFQENYLAWENMRARSDGLTDSEVKFYETANPSWLSALGIFRYWHKFRNPARNK